MEPWVKVPMSRGPSLRYTELLQEHHHNHKEEV